MKQKQITISATSNPIPARVTINETELPIKEYQGQRVVTLKEIDAVHQRPNGTAGRNFRENRGRFIEGIDYFRVGADEIRRHKIVEISPKAHEDIILLTESGYLMLVKSFTDDLAWVVQRQLVNVYFKSTPEQKQEAAVQTMSDAEAMAYGLRAANRLIAESL